VGNTNLSLVFIVTVFNQYFISTNIFFEAVSGMVCNLYSRKNYSLPEGALYFILFFKRCRRLQRTVDIPLAQEATTEQNMILYMVVFFLR